MATALLGANGKAITGSDGFLVPHAYTFQALFNSFSRQYSYRYDEALRNSPANALAMKRDAYYIGLLQERTAPTINLPWSLETDDEDDAAQAYVRSQLTKIIKKTPRLIGLKQAAMEALWYGRAGAQIEMRQPCYGEPFQVSKWSPVNGDKIQFGHDGVPSILVNSTTASEYEGIRAGCTTNHDRGGKLLKLVEQSWRDRFLIHQHDIVDADYYDAVAGGSIGGVGVRHLVYWSGWMRTEALTWMLAFMESVGMADLLIFNYLSSDSAAKKAAIDNANQITGKLALVVPRGANETYPAVESIQVNSQGVQFLRDLIEGYFDRHIERVIVGQTLSAGTEGSGLGGTGVADFHKDTKYQLIKTDVEKLDETLTTDLVRVLLKLNFPWAKFDVRWKSSLPDPEAKDKLESGLKLVQAGVPLKAMELRKLAGFTAPEEGDEVVGGQQQMPGMDGGMGQGAGALPPGGDGDPMAALGGGATTPEQADPMAGMGGIGADDVLDPELQDALMAAIMQAMEEGDSATVQALCDMAGDPGTLQAILAGEQPPADSYASDEELWLYSWQGAQTKGGKVKAVGVGEHAGRTLYGARAEAALRGKQPKGPSKEAQRKAGVQERKQARQASAQAAMEIATKAMNGQATPDDFAELPNHLPLLNSTQIRNIRRRLGIKLGGLRRRDEMAQQLIDHAKQQIEGGRATTQPEGETLEKPVQDEVQAGASALDLTPENVQSTWERFRDEIVAHDPKLSPQAAGSIAAARIMKNVDDEGKRFREDIDRRIQNGEQITDDEDIKYGEVGDLRKQLYHKLVTLSGYRPGADVEQHPLANRPFSDKPLESAKRSPFATSPDFVPADGGRATSQPEGETLEKPVPEEVAAGGANASGDKQPHEMTHAEWDAAFAEAVRNNLAKKKKDRVPYTKLFPGGDVHSEVVRKAHAAGHKIPPDVLNEYPDLKEPHERTQAEYDAIYDRNSPGYRHPTAKSPHPFGGTHGQFARKSDVLRAFIAGKTVPPEVLADYPDLAGRATTQQPEATPEKPATPVDKEYQDASIPPVEQQPATTAPGGDDMAQQAQQAQAAGGRATTLDTKKLAEDVYGAFKDVPAQGRFGDNKVFISHLWEHMRKTNAAYKDVSLDEFKQQLLAGHRSNDLDLSRADLVQAMERQSVEGSLINSGNAEYHFVTLKNKPYKPLPAVQRPARDPITGRVIRPEQPAAGGRATTTETPAAAPPAAKPTPQAAPIPKPAAPVDDKEARRAAKAEKRAAKAEKRAAVAAKEKAEHIALRDAQNKPVLDSITDPETKAVVSNAMDLTKNFYGGGTPKEHVDRVLSELEALPTPKLLEAVRKLNMGATLTDKSPRSKIVNQMREILIRTWKTSDNVNH